MTKVELTREEMVLIKRLLHYRKYSFELYDAKPRTLDTPNIGSDVISGSEILSSYYTSHQKDILNILEKVFDHERK